MDIHLIPLDMDKTLKVSRYIGTATSQASMVLIGDSYELFISTGMGR